MASPAAAAAAQEQQSRQGRVYYDKFIAWCGKSEATPSTELLMQWDAEHNLSRIKSLFGTDQDVYRVGLQALYTRFFSNYSMLRIESPSGKKVSLSPYRKTGEGIGNVGDLSSPNLTVDQLEFVRSKAKLTARNAAERLRIFKLDKEEVIGLFNEAIEEAYA